MQLVPFNKLPFDKVEQYLQTHPQPVRMDLANAVGCFITEPLWLRIKQKYNIKIPVGSQLNADRVSANPGKAKQYFAENPDGGSHYEFCKFLNDYRLSGSNYRRNKKKYCNGVATVDSKGAASKGMCQTVCIIDGRCDHKVSAVMREALTALSKFTGMNFELVEYPDEFEIRNKTR